jgi:hypothetical protein
MANAGSGIRLAVIAHAVGDDSLSPSRRAMALRRFVAWLGYRRRGPRYRSRAPRDERRGGGLRRNRAETSCDQTSGGSDGVNHWG